MRGTKETAHMQGGLRQNRRDDMARRTKETIHAGGLMRGRSSLWVRWEVHREALVRLSTLRDQRDDMQGRLGRVADGQSTTQG